MSDFFSIFPNENFVDLSIFQFGREMCAPSKSFGPAFRNHFLFHYILSGKGRLMAHDLSGKVSTYDVGPGQGFMLYPRQISTYIADLDEPWEYIWIEFDGLRTSNLLSAAGFTESSPVYSAHSVELRDEMLSELVYITEHASSSPFHLIGHLFLFFDYLVRSSAPAKQESKNRLRDCYVHEAIDFIEHNYNKNITIEDVAEVCGLNRSYFGKIFKDALGKSPQEFLLSFRMAKAVELLRLTQMPVGDIGTAVGYENPMHFSRAFKSVYGVSPKKMRK